MPMTEAQKRAIKKYQSKVVKQLQIKLYKGKDADIIARLDEVESKQGYVKALIRADIERNVVKTHKF